MHPEVYKERAVRARMAWAWGVRGMFQATGSSTTMILINGQVFCWMLVTEDPRVSWR